MSPTDSTTLELPKLDRWIQRLAAGLMLALALSLVAMGLALYLPHPAQHAVSTLNQEDTSP